MRLTPSTIVLCAGLLVTPALLTNPANALAAAHLAADVDLRPRFQVGQDVRFRLETSAVSDNQMPGGGAQQTKDAQDIVVRLSPKEVTEAGSTVELTYESIKVTIEGSPRGPQTFDSAQDPAADTNPFAQALRPLVGMTLTLKIDANGNITEVTGAENAALNRRNPFASRLTTTPGVSALFGRIISANRASGQASVGQSWQTVDAFDQGPMGRLKLTADSTLMSHDSNKAAIDIKGTFALDSDAAAASMLKLTEGTYTGQAVWDTAAGMLHSMNVSQVTSLEGDTAVGRVATKRTSTEKVTRMEGDAPAAPAKPTAEVGS